MSHFHVSQVKNTLWTHVKKQIENRKIIQESMFRLIYLIISFWGKIIILCWVFRVDGSTEISNISRLGLSNVCGAIRHIGLNINQFTYLLPYRLIEINQINPSLFKEGANIVLIVLKEW